MKPHVDSASKFKTNISFCTGSRGLERGIERTGTKLRTLAHVEIEAFICENLVQQMEQGVLDEAPIWTNLKTFNGKPFRGMVDILTGGYPCQPFSVAGQRKGTEDPRHLWPYIKDLIRTIRPVCCFFENVPGHITLGYREVRSDLEQLGYTVEEGIFSAEEVGAPHQRKRLFIIAVDNSYCQRFKQDNKIQTRRNSIEYASSSMGNTEIKCRKQSGVSWTRWTRFTNSSSELVYTGYIGRWASEKRIDPNKQKERGRRTFTKEYIGHLQHCGSEQDSEQSELRSNCIIEPSSYRWQTITTKGIEGQEGNRWPARPGQEQFEWEEPHVESRMGLSIDGYNFREDLLRMAGNSVVEQTAEKAWITLWNKFDLTLNV